MEAKCKCADHGQGANSLCSTLVPMRKGMAFLFSFRASRNQALTLANVLGRDRSKQKHNA
eukprot:837216-Amorphochlora_amoeboformis.AAC.2